MNDDELLQALAAEDASIEVWAPAADELGDGAESLRLVLLASPQPVLLLAPNAAALPVLLAIARADDEVASRDEPLQALKHRLRRVAQRALRSTQQPQETDPLTGLRNRHAMQRALQALVAQQPAPEGAHGLVLVDLDHFKVVNDQHGHAAGDDVLKAVALQLRQHARGADLCARWGGEEFVVLMHRDDPAGLRRDAERLRQQLAVPLPGLTGPDTQWLTASAGLAFLAPGLALEAWLAHADQALYSAKARGRSQSVVYETLAGEVDDPGALQVQHFDNVTRVVTERVASLVSLMGQQMLREIQREAQNDALTGVANRRVFDRRMARELALCAEDERPLALLLLDIDHFGRFNREHGVPTADAVLRQFAQAVALGIRPSDWLARYGGEEFCVVMPADEAAALQAAERLRALVAGTLMRGQDGQPLHITVSVGVALHRGAPETVEALVQRASKALQAGKQAGRNRVMLAA